MTLTAPATPPASRPITISWGEGPIRAAEVVGALSLATDLGTGQPACREDGSGRQAFNPRMVVALLL